MPKTLFKYTKRRVDIICDELYNLSSKLTASEKAGISYKTFKTWYDTIPEFKERVDDSLENSKMQLKSKAIETVIKSFETDFKAACWWLERVYPEEFSKKDTSNVNMTIDSVKIKYIMPSEENNLLDNPSVKIIDTSNDKLLNE